MATLQTPIVNAITPFDPSVSHDISFSYTDNQAVRNRAVITDNKTSTIVYDQTQSSMRLSHTVPAGTLTAGNQYLVQIQVWDADGNSSILSDAALFYCFTTPTFNFSNISDGDSYNNANITLNLNYAQAENEPIRSFQFMMYSSNQTLISSSDVMYSSSAMEYTFYSMYNNTVYYFRAIGETSHGITLDTGYVGITAFFNTISAKFLIDAENNKNEGYISIRMNIKSVSYELGSEDYTISDGMVTLLDNYIDYNDGFLVDGNMNLFLEAATIPIGTVVNTDNGVFSVDVLDVCGTYYCHLSVANSTFNQFVALPDATVTADGGHLQVLDASTGEPKIIGFNIIRLYGIYSLTVYYPTT